MIKIPLAAGAALLLTLTGCGSSTSRPQAATSAAAPASPTASPAGPASDPCALLTGADAAALKLHYPGSPTSTDFGAACDFGAMQFTVVRPAVSEQSFTYGATKPVAGLGEHAYYGKDFHWLRVQTAHSRFEVRCTLCDSTTEEATLQYAAKRALTHVT